MSWGKTQVQFPWRPSFQLSVRPCICIHLSVCVAHYQQVFVYVFICLSVQLLTCRVTILSLSEQLFVASNSDSPLQILLVVVSRFLAYCAVDENRDSSSCDSVAMKSLPGSQGVVTLLSLNGILETQYQVSSMQRNCCSWAQTILETDPCIKILRCCLSCSHLNDSVLE